MARTKIFRRSNDNSLNKTWKPILESHGADMEKTPWLAEYAHNHAIFDNSAPVFEQYAGPGQFLQTPPAVPGMGAATPATDTPFTAGGAKGSYTSAGTGSGDKFPSLLPVAIQVAAKTIGFDLVPVVPMDSPVGFLPYLDYLYTGGRTDNETEPFMVKIQGCLETDLAGGTLTPGSDITHSAATGTYEVVGFSRVDGHLILKVLTSPTGTATVAADLTGNITQVGGVALTAAHAVAAADVQLVSALENHISGFSGVSDDDYATTAFNGPYLPGTGDVNGSMQREASESSRFRNMGLRMFTKFIEAESDQVAISATVEQIQDLNRVWNYDVVSMLENVAVNDLAQTINKRLVDNIFNLGTVHATEVALVEGANVAQLSLVGAGGFENVSTMQRRLVTKVLELANLIYHRGRFGAGTFMVTNGRVASALADVAGYSIANVPTDMAGVAGNLYPAGKVYGVQVYVDPNLTFGDDRICIGRKGADEEPGVKFMPYIMAESLQTIAEGTFSPKIGMKSRYAITEAGWHPETQYCMMDITGELGMLTGSAEIK